MSTDININNFSEMLNDKAELDFSNVDISEEFKDILEEAGIRYVRETWTEGTSWYRVYSDGFIEQGGRGNTSNSTVTMTLFKPYKNMNYCVTAGCNTSGSYASATACNIISNTQFQLRCGGTTEWMWRACGY